MLASLDPVDRTILSLLQSDASLSTAEIAARAGASQSSVWRRIEKLESSGVIKKRVALLDRHKLGLDMMVFAHVKLQAHGQRTLPQFEEASAVFLRLWNATPCLARRIISCVWSRETPRPTRHSSGGG